MFACFCGNVLEIYDKNILVLEQDLNNHGDVVRHLMIHPGYLYIAVIFVERVLILSYNSRDGLETLYTIDGSNEYGRLIHVIWEPRCSGINYGVIYEHSCLDHGGEFKKYSTMFPKSENFDIISMNDSFIMLSMTVDDKIENKVIFPLIGRASEYNPGDNLYNDEQNQLELSNDTLMYNEAPLAHNVVKFFVYLRKLVYLTRDGTLSISKHSGKYINCDGSVSFEANLCNS